MQVQKVGMNAQSFGSIKLSPQELQKVLKMENNSNFQELMRMYNSKNRPETRVTKMVFNWLKSLITLKKKGYEIGADTINAERTAAIRRLGKNGTEGITEQLYNHTLDLVEGCCHNSYILKSFRTQSKNIWPPVV